MAYTKKAKHIYGHIYEHMLGWRASHFSIENNYLRPIEYDMFATTRDDNVIIRFDRKISKKLKAFSKEKFSETELLHAVGEISCEYNRQAKLKDVQKLLDIINEIATKKWARIDRSMITDINYEEDIFRSPEIDFLKKSKKDFVNYEIFYDFKQLPNELRPIAVYAAITIALTVIYMFYNDHECFDVASEWNKYSGKTQFYHILCCKKGEFKSVANFKSVFDKYFNRIMEDYNIKKKLLKYLRKTKVSKLYFDNAELEGMAGYIVGRKGWRKLVNSKNIEVVFDALKITAKLV